MTPLHFTGPAATAVWSLLRDPRCSLGHSIDVDHSVSTGKVTLEQPPHGLRDGQLILWQALSAFALMAPLAFEVDADNRAAYAQAVSELLGVSEVAVP